MNRENMLAELKNIDLRAIPTVATMDMGLQYDYATSEGAGTGFGGMGDWPAHKFMPIRKERWLRIREAIKSNSLTTADLEGTGLDTFLGKFSTIDYEVVPSEALKGLLNLSEELSGPFYCFFDDGLWYDEHAERPVFFTSEKELKSEFIQKALQLAKDLQQPDWVIKDILIDLRNHELQQGHTQNTYKESDAQKELHELDELSDLYAGIDYEENDKVEK